MNQFVFDRPEFEPLDLTGALDNPALSRGLLQAREKYAHYISEDLLPAQQAWAKRNIGNDLSDYVLNNPTIPFSKYRCLGDVRHEILVSKNLVFTYMDEGRMREYVDNKGLRVCRDRLPQSQGAYAINLPPNYDYVVKDKLRRIIRDVQPGLAAVDQGVTLANIDYFVAYYITWGFRRGGSIELDPIVNYRPVFEHYFFRFADAHMLGEYIEYDIVAYGKTAFPQVVNQFEAIYGTGSTFPAPMHLQPKYRG